MALPDLPGYLKLDGLKKRIFIVLIILQIIILLIGVIDRLIIPRVGLPLYIQVLFYIFLFPVMLMIFILEWDIGFIAAVLFTLFFDYIFVLIVFYLNKELRKRPAKT